MSETVDRTPARPDNAATVALRLAAGAERFCTPTGEAFVRVRRDGHQETYAVGDHGGFRQWLRGRYFAQTGRPLSTQAAADVAATIQAMAAHEGVVHPVFTRVGAHGEALYLDLADAQWRVVEIDAAGWRLCPDPPVRFRRARGMLPLPLPERGGDLAELRSLLNLADEDGWRLLVGWLLAALRPVGPYPILALHGERGCAKSTTTRLLRTLIDPAVPPSRDAAREPRDLAIAARNGWVLAFDNLSRLPEWLSDAFCRLATGGGFATRQLHTDAEESLFWAQRPVVMNGIEELATRGDLLDRSLVLTLPVIPPKARREEAVLDAAFREAHPRLLGALLSAAAGALAALPGVVPTALPRLADFARWVIAAAPSLGWEPAGFALAYQRNRANAVSVELEASPVGQAMQRLLVGRDWWEGTATELLGELARLCPELAEGRAWPRTARGCTGELRRIQPALRVLGLGVEFWREGHANVRKVRVQRPAGPSDG